MRIHKYLDKIKLGQVVNFDAFCNQLQQQGHDKQEILKIFSAERKSRTNYVIKIIDKELFSELLIKFPAHKITDRTSAAQAGDSHKYPVSQAMIILWSYQQQHPVVILNSATVINTPVELGKRLLIIENQENFLRKQDTIQFLQQQFPNFNTTNLDIAFGSGNEITNKLNKNFFNHYKHIDCLLDLDIGGLKIFSALLKLIDERKVNFLLPPCLDELLPKSKINITDEDLFQLREYNKKYPILRDAITLIGKYRKMLEQELYLRG